MEQGGEMDRTRQLSNVSFGGAWSEQIAADEALSQGLELLAESAKLSLEMDVRANMDVCVALEQVCRAHPKGDMLRDAWHKGAGITVPGMRAKELCRISALLAEAFSGRLK